jgi:hypothetical protein
MQRGGFTSALCALLASMVLCWPAASEAQTEASRGRVARLLDQSGYSFKKINEVVWTVPYTGKSLPDYQVILTVKDELAIIFVVVAKSADIRTDARMQRTALNLNHRFDRVKVGIDNDGDLFVRVDVTTSTLNLAEFKRNVEQVANASDESHAALKAWLSK